jgi:hypothetical protein
MGKKTSPALTCGEKKFIMDSILPTFFGGEGERVGEGDRLRFRPWESSTTSMIWGKGTGVEKMCRILLFIEKV